MLALISAILISGHAMEKVTEIRGTNLISSKTETFELQQKKGAVIVFLSAKCPCSMSHVQELKNLNAGFKDFQFVGVHSNANEDLEESKSYFRSVDLPFSIIQDQNYQLADRFRALKTPHAFVIDREGQVLYQGGVSNSRVASQADRHFLREALEDINSGRPVRMAEGRTLGCAISR